MLKKKNKNLVYKTYIYSKLKEATDKISHSINTMSLVSTIGSKVLWALAVRKKAYSDHQASGRILFKKQTLSNSRIGWAELKTLSNS